MWCIAAISSTSTSTSTSVPKDFNNLKWNENNFNDITPQETVGSAIISLSIEGEVNIWQPIFSNLNKDKNRNKLISKTEQIFTLFAIQFNLKGSYISRNVRNNSNRNNFDIRESSTLKLSGNDISDSIDDNGYNKNNYNKDIINDDNNCNIRNYKNIISANSNKNDDKRNKIEAVSGTMDPSCRTILISFSDGSIQLWPLLGIVLNDTFDNDIINSGVVNNINNDINSNIINNNIIKNDIYHSHHNDGNIHNNLYSLNKSTIAVCNSNLWETVQHTDHITSIRVWTQERNWNLNNNKNINLNINNYKLNHFNDLNEFMAIVDTNLIKNLNVLASTSTMISCSKDFSLILWKFSVVSIENNKNNMSKNNIINQINNKKDTNDGNNNDEYNQNGGIRNSNLNYKNIGFSFFLQPIMCRKFYFSSPPHEGLCFLLPLPSSTSYSSSSSSNPFEFPIERNKDGEKEKNMNSSNDISMLTIKQKDDRQLYQISAILNGTTVTVTRNIKKNIFSTYIFDDKIIENEHKNDNEIIFNQNKRRNHKIIIPVGKEMKNENENEKEKEEIKNVTFPSHSLFVPMDNIFVASQLFSKRSIRAFGSSMEILKSWDRGVYDNSFKDPGIVHGMEGLD